VVHTAWQRDQGDIGNRQIGIAVATSPLRRFLTGGDRRSQAQATRALAQVRADPSRVSELAALAQDADWLVSMRAVDLLEKLAHENPDWIEPHKRLFLGALADSEQWEIRLQIVRALPLLPAARCDVL
jgi:hypothetical protein